MAEPPRVELRFEGGCPDCGRRHAELPLPLPQIEDDFDWRVRDYDSFRLFLMEELAYRFPERRRWTPADLEVAIVELLAAALDRASHALDTIQRERFLDSARRPQSVRRLLSLIGYDALEHTDRDLLAMLPPPGDASGDETAEQKLERYWRLNPQAMEEARLAGPRLVREQRRMVTLEDHQLRIEAHPLVARARAKLVWTGAWNTILVSSLLIAGLELDTPLHTGAATGGVPSMLDEHVWAQVTAFHEDHQLALPAVTGELSARALIRLLIERYRMVGSEVFLENAKQVPIAFILSVRVAPNFFRSEVRDALAEVFSAAYGGFFEPGQRGFGEDLFASDIIEAAMTVEGVETACLNLFKRIGAKYPDQSDSGLIRIEDDEVATCMNRPGAAEDGYFRLVINGGEVG